MNAATREFWQRAWLQELGVDWRRPLPRLGEPAPEASAPASEPGPESSTKGRGQGSSARVSLAPPAATPAAPRGAEPPPGASSASSPSRPPPMPQPAAGRASLTSGSASATEPAQVPGAGPSSIPGQPPTPAMPPVDASVSVAAPERAAFQLAGKWRWSWWQPVPGAAGGPALLLRPWLPPGEDDPRGRELLANAMAAIGRQPMAGGRSVVAGVLSSGCHPESLLALVSQAPVTLPAGAVPVVVCMPHDWPLPPQPSPLTGWEVGTSATLAETPPGLQLALIPAPPVMLRLGAAAKRLAWRALAPLQGSGN